MRLVDVTKDEIRAAADRASPWVAFWATSQFVLILLSFAIGRRPEPATAIGMLLAGILTGTLTLTLLFLVAKRRNTLKEAEAPAASS